MSSLHCPEALVPILQVFTIARVGRVSNPGLDQFACLQSSLGDHSLLLQDPDTYPSEDQQQRCKNKNQKNPVENLSCLRLPTVRGEVSHAGLGLISSHRHLFWVGILQLYSQQYKSI